MVLKSDPEIGTSRMCQNGSEWIRMDQNGFEFGPAIRVANSLDRLPVRQILAEKDLRRPEQPSGHCAGGFFLAP